MQTLFLINHFTSLNFLRVKVAFTCHSIIFTDNLHVLKYNSDFSKGWFNSSRETVKVLNSFLQIDAVSSSMTLEKQPRATCHWCACMRLSYEAATSKWVLLNAAAFLAKKKKKRKDQVILPVDLFLNQWTKAVLVINFYQHYLPRITELFCQTTLIRRFRHYFILLRCHFPKLEG